MLATKVLHNAFPKIGPVTQERMLGSDVKIHLHKITLVFFDASRGAAGT